MKARAPNMSNFSKMALTAVQTHDLIINFVPESVAILTDQKGQKRKKV